MSLSNLTTIFQQQADANAGNITINASTFSDASLTPPADLDKTLAGAYHLADGTPLEIKTSEKNT